MPSVTKLAEVDLAATVAAGEVMVGLLTNLLAQRVGVRGGLIVAHLGEPIDRVLAAVFARRAWRITNGEMHLPTGEVEIFGNLAARLTGTHDQHLAIRDLRRVLVVLRMDLMQRERQALANAWDRRYVISGNGHHDVIRSPIAR